LDLPAKHAVSGAVMGAFYVVAESTVVVWALTDHNPLMRTNVVLGLVAASVLLAPLIAYGFHRFSRTAFQVILAGTMCAVAAAIVAGGNDIPLAFLFIWPLPYVVAIFKRRQVLTHLAVMFGVYGAALVLLHVRRGHGPGLDSEDVVHWLFLTMTALSASAFVLRMRSALSASTRRLRQRAAQQAAISELGAAALSTVEVSALLERAVTLTRATLGVDVTTVLETLPGAKQMLIRAGRGLPIGKIGVATVPVDHQSQAAHTLRSDGPIVVEDYRTETRFQGSELLRSLGVRSGVTVPIAGRGVPFGILAAHTTEQRTFGEDEVHFLQSIANVLAAAIERRLSEQETRHQALHDPLTGLPNRLLFRDRLEHAVARATRMGSSLAVMFLDVDNFKVINDSLGHEAGDELLIELAPRLSQAVRGGDTVARFGGDEFVLLCEELENEADAREIAERVQACFARPFVLRGAEHFASASIGVAVRGSGEDGPEGFVRDADAAMYQAKQRGRARYEVFDATMRSSALDRLRIEAELRQAIERGELRLHYQPVVSLTTGEIAAVEALVRWQHPERGLLGPGEFVPVAEETGLIVPMGQWVLQEAIRMAGHWRALRAEPPPPLVVSVNLSARQIVEPGFVAMVARMLDEAGVDPRQLALEITESQLVEDPLASAETLSALRELGVKAVLDDFGTGYSSLGYVKHFPLDFLKLDRSFVAELSERDAAIVGAVVEMSRALEARVVAEGIETEAQLDQVIALGCDLAQGFYFARPLPPERIDDLLREAPWRTPSGEGVARGTAPVNG
jgi:diguanylate cyclase (GGDEF)-like protein